MYYIEGDTGSKLMQIDPLDKTKTPAHPVLSGDVTVTSGDNLSSALKTTYDKITATYNRFKNDTALILTPYDVVTNVTTVNHIRDSIESRYNLFKHSPSDVTVDNYKEYIDTAIAQRKVLIDYLVQIREETKGSIKERLKAVPKSVTSLLCTLHSSKECFEDANNPHIPAARTMLMVYSKELQAVPDQMLNISIFKYLPYKCPSGYVADNPKRYPNTFIRAREARAILQKLVPVFTQWREANPDVELNPKWRKHGEVQGLSQLFVDTLTDNEQAVVLNFFDNHSGVSYKYKVEYDRDYANYPDITLTSLDNKFQALHKEISKTIDALDAINFEAEVLTNIADYLVVGHKKSTGAYTNSIKVPKTYDKDGISMTLPAIKGFDEYIIYRRAYKEGNYLEVGRTETTAFSATPKYDRGGVPVVPYRLKEPHTDYTSIAEYRGAIFLNRKNSQEIYYTSPNNPHDMKVTDYIKMPQDVKAMKTAGSGLFIWTINNALYLLKGSPHNAQGDNTLNIKLVGEGVDIINSNSVTSQDSLVVWLSEYAIHNTSGYGSADATRYIWETPDIQDVLQSIVYKNNILFLCKTVKGNIIIEYDTSRKAIRVVDTVVESLSVVNIDVAQHTKTRLVGIVPNSTHPLELFQGTTLVPYDVTLKRFAGYSFDLRQTFSSVTIFHTPKPYETYDPNNITTAHISIDEAVVQVVELKGYKATRIPIPTQNNKGYSLEIRLEGSLGINSVRVRYAPINWED